MVLIVNEANATECRSGLETNIPEFRIAVVTGAARGLGLSIAKSLASDGHLCILVDRLAEVEDVAKEISGPSRQAEGYRADLAKPQDMAGLIDRIVARHGRLDILVNNAGINPLSAGNAIYAFEDIPLDTWNDTLAVNLTSVFYLCQKVIPHMRARRWGRIINISSRTARTYTGTASANYVASKSGILGLTRQIAGEFGPYGITANCIAPGPIVSPMSLADGGNMNETRAASSPLRRVGMPQEIGATVGFLASEEAAYITGAIIDLNGGSFMP